MRNSSAIVTALVSVGLITATCLAALPDQLSGDGLTVRFTDKSKDSLRGTLELSGKSYPFTAQPSGDEKLTGTFTVDGQAYQFTMTRSGDGAVLETDGTKYTLKPKAADPAPPPSNDSDPKPKKNPTAGGSAYQFTFARQPFYDPKTKVLVGSVMVPEGWKLDPGVLWREMDAQFVSLQTAIFDPQSGLAVRWIPHDQFSYAPLLYDTAIQQGNQPRTIGGIWYSKILPNALQYIEAVVLPKYRNLQGLKVVKREDLPELAKVIDASQPYTRWLYNQGGRDLKYTAARMRVEYPSQGDETLEEEIYCVLNTSWSPREIANAQAVGMEAPYFFMPDRIYSFTAPKGKLDEAMPYMQSIPLSMRPDANWLKFLENIQGSVTAITNSQYRMEEAYRRQITDSQRKSVEESWKSADRQSDDVGFLLNNSRAYTNKQNPGGPTHSSPGGSRPWQDGKGNIKDFPEGHNPNEDPNSTKDWTPLDPAAPAR